MERPLQLLKTDKNGTKYYADYNCPRCGGEGYIFGFEYIQGGVCFKCGGSGERPRAKIIKEYTPEYKAKLEEQRAKRRRKDAPKRNQALFAENGFNPEGQTYIVLGDTYAIKDELKEKGAHFNRTLGWHFDAPVEEYPTALITVDDCYEQNIYGEYTGYFDMTTIKNVREAYIVDQNQKSSKSEFLGDVGSRLNLNISSHEMVTHWDTEYGRTYLYKFLTPEGNVLTWKTGKFIKDEDVLECITGTVKAHTEFKGIRQTELTRCKVV